MKTVLERYPGAQPFRTDQKPIFFGREKDQANLHRMVKLSTLTVLHSKSGMGKSSLINAGLIPKLEEENRYEYLTIRFTAYDKDREHEMPLDKTKHLLRLKKETLTENKNDAHSTFLDKLIKNENTLWHDIKEYQILHKEGKGLLIIFDQFEELFTYPKSAILAFQKELSEALYTPVPQRYWDILEEKEGRGTALLSPEELRIFQSPPLIKGLLAIRSDRLHLLDQLSHHIPNILKNCYVLDSLDANQARAAIVEPAMAKPVGETFVFSSPVFNYEDKAVDEIINFLNQGGESKIELTQLQIVCHSFERKVVKNSLAIIGMQDVEKLDNIINGFYEEKIAELDVGQQDAARQLVEEGLIFEEEKRRLTLYEGQILKEYSISEEALRQLVDSHLLRSESSAKGGYTYELSHDTLVGPILRSKEIRMRRERLVKEKEEAYERELKAQAELEEKNRELEEAKRQRRRNYRWAVFGIILSIISMVSAFYAFDQRDQAKEAELKALEAEKDAITAKEKALESEEAAIAATKAAKDAASAAKTAALAEEEAKKEALENLAKAERAQKESDKQTKKANFMVANLFNEKADGTFKAKDYDRSWLFTLESLNPDRDTDKDPLPAATGRLLFPELHQNDNNESGSISLDFPVASIDVSGKGNHIAIGSNNNQLNVLDLKNGKNIRDKFLLKKAYGQSADGRPKKSDIEGIAYHPKKDMIAFYAASHDTIFVNKDSFIFNEKVYNWPSSSSENVQFVNAKSKDEINIGKTVFVFEKNNNAPKINALFNDGSQGVSAIAYNNKGDGYSLASGYADGGLVLWSLQNGQHITLNKNNIYRAVNCIEFSPNDKLLAAGFENNRLLIWDIEKNEITDSVIMTNQSVRAVSFDEKNRYIALGTSENEIHVYDLKKSTKKPIKKLVGHKRPITNLKFKSLDKLINFNRDRQLFLSSSFNKLFIWDFDKEKKIAEITTNQPITDLKFGPKGRLIWVGTAGNEIRLLNLDLVLFSDNKKALALDDYLLDPNSKKFRKKLNEIRERSYKELGYELDEEDFNLVARETAGGGIPFFNPTSTPTSTHTADVINTEVSTLSIEPTAISDNPPVPMKRAEEFEVGEDIIKKSDKVSGVEIKVDDVIKEKGGYLNPDSKSGSYSDIVIPSDYSAQAYQGKASYYKSKPIVVADMFNVGNFHKFVNTASDNYPIFNNGEIILTEDKMKNAGAVVFSDKKVTPPFEVNFEYNIYNKEGAYGYSWEDEPADGLVFMFMKNKNAYKNIEVPSGSHRGFLYDSTGYGVHFATFRKNAIILTDGKDDYGLADSRDLVISNYLAPIYSHDKWRRVKIMVEKDRVRVYYEGVEVFTKLMTVDTTYPYIGFGAGNGGADSRHSIRNIWVTKLE